MTGALPEGWLVLEGTSDPSPPVDRTALRAVLACVRGERVSAKEKNAPHRDPQKYETLKARLASAPKIPKASQEYAAVAAWSSCVATDLGDHSPPHSSASAAEVIRHYRELLRQRIHAMEVQDPSLRIPTARKRRRKAPKK